MTQNDRIDALSPGTFMLDGEEIDFGPGVKVEEGIASPDHITNANVIGLFVDQGWRQQVGQSGRVHRCGFKLCLAWALLQMMRRRPG